MHLNIKNDLAHQMAKELAHLTGESMSTAVIRSIEARLERVRGRETDKRKGLSGELIQLADEFSALPDLDDRHPDDILYDEDGLPR